MLPRATIPALISKFGRPLSPVPQTCLPTHPHSPARSPQWPRPPSRSRPAAAIHVNPVTSYPLSSTYTSDVINELIQPFYLTLRSEFIYYTIIYTTLKLLTFDKNFVQIVQCTNYFHIHFTHCRFNLEHPLDAFSGELVDFDFIYQRFG